MEEPKFEVILTLVNAGFADVVMGAARGAGARGGTIIHSRGTGNPEIEEKYNVIITPDKEMVMILVPSEIKDAIMSAIYKAAGIGNGGQGIVFSLPVTDAVGLKFD